MAATSFAMNSDIRDAKDRPTSMALAAVSSEYAGDCAIASISEGILEYRSMTSLRSG